MKSGVGVLILFGAVGAFLWLRKKSVKPAPLVVPIQPLQPGMRLTGKTTQTTNTGAPGQTEIIGYAVRAWAEVETATGQKDWVEIRR